MNRLFKFFGVIAIVLAFTSAPTIKASAQFGASISFQTFYDELSPYGNWINDPEYGYVWSPQVGNDFRPYYSSGRWAMTEYGNTWVSDYDWGWAPFHYGRWTFDDYYGWLWIPGNDWGPAWVSWRQGGGYYGWAPMGPGININVSFGNNYYVPDPWWVFIPNQYIYSNNYYSYWGGPRYNNTIIYNTTIINNVYDNRYVCGPNRRDIERYGGRVTVYDIRNGNSPRGGNRLSNNSVSIYRPVVRTTNGGRSEAPRNTLRTERKISRDNIAAVRTDMRSERSNNTVSRNDRSRTENTGRDERMPDRFDRSDRQGNDRFRSQPAERNMETATPSVNSRRGAFNGRGDVDAQQNNRQEDYNRQRMEQYQAQRNNRSYEQPQQRTQERQERPQREWRRPEPQQAPQRMEQERQQQMERQQTQRQQMERQQMERQQMQRQRVEQERPQQMQRQQMERPQAQPQQRYENRGGGSAPGRRR